MLRRTASVVVLIATLAVAGIVLSTEALAGLDDDAAPAVRAQSRVADEAADLETAVSAWAVGGQVTARAEALQGREELEAAFEALRRATADDADLAAAVEAEAAIAERWLDEYATPLAASPGGPESFDLERFNLGQQLLAEWREARDRVDQLVDDRLGGVSDSTLLWLRVTLVLAVMVTALAWLWVSQARSRLVAGLYQPLQALEQVVQRMLRNDPEGRAVAHQGPKEVRAIARALNDFADAQSRARAVEVRITDELRELDTAKDDFVSNVSHELRTPLTTISGYLEMVADEFEGSLEPRHDRMLEATRRNVTRLRTLIDDLLALSKAENRPVSLEPADVTELVRDAVVDVRMTAARRRIVVELDAPDQPMPVVSDRSMLYRAFLNVLTNAVKFSHDEGTVEVSVRRRLDRVEVAVRDRGIGIPSAELDRLGTRFFRASNAMSNEIAGTGLGLRIVQTIVDKHDGDVVIESAEGDGTTVYLRLRLHRDVPHDPEPAPGDAGGHSEAREDDRDHGVPAERPDGGARDPAGRGDGAQPAAAPGAVPATGPVDVKVAGPVAGPGAGPGAGPVLVSE